MVSQLGDTPVPYLSRMDYYYLYKWDIVMEENPSFNRQDHLNYLRDGWKNLSVYQRTLFSKLSSQDYTRFMNEIDSRSDSKDISKALHYRNLTLKMGVYRSPLFYYLWKQFGKRFQTMDEEENVNEIFVQLFEEWNHLEDKDKQEYIHISLIYANKYAKEPLEEGEVSLSSFSRRPHPSSYYCSILKNYGTTGEYEPTRIMDALTADYKKLSDREKLPFITIYNEVIAKRREVMEKCNGS